MQTSFFTLLAIFAAVPALAVDIGEITQASGGSMAARAAAQAQADDGTVSVDAAAAQLLCRFPASVLGNTGLNPPPTNVDGSCITANACAGVGGRAFTNVCPSGTFCCIKNDCAGPNSNTACLLPNLQGDPIPAGSSIRPVSGSCPAGLQCFQLIR